MKVIQIMQFKNLNIEPKFMILQYQQRKSKLIKKKKENTKQLKSITIQILWMLG